MRIWNLGKLKLEVIWEAAIVLDRVEWILKFIYTYVCMYIVDSQLYEEVKLNIEYVVRAYNHDTRVTSILLLFFFFN